MHYLAWFLDIYLHYSGIYLQNQYGMNVRNLILADNALVHIQLSISGCLASVIFVHSSKISDWSESYLCSSSQRLGSSQLNLILWYFPLLILCYVVYWNTAHMLALDNRFPFLRSWHQPQICMNGLCTLHTWLCGGIVGIDKTHVTLCHTMYFLVGSPGELRCIALLS